MTFVLNRLEPFIEKAVIAPMFFSWYNVASFNVEVLDIRVCDIPHDILCHNCFRGTPVHFKLLCPYNPYKFKLSGSLFYPVCVERYWGHDSMSYFITYNIAILYF